MTIQTYPTTTVGALIFNEKSEILLIKTHKWHHKYGLPGGKIELGETAENALIREFKEETDLDIFDIKFILMQDCIFSEEFYKPIHFIFLNYTAKTISKEIILNDEAQSYIWVSLENALLQDLNTPTRLLVQTVLNDKL